MKNTEQYSYNMKGCNQKYVGTIKNKLLWTGEIVPVMESPGGHFFQLKHKDNYIIKRA